MATTVNMRAPPISCAQTALTSGTPAATSASKRSADRITSFSLGQYTWCAVWFPEAFPTRIRAAAVSFCFNAPHLIAFVGPLVSGHAHHRVRQLRACRHHRQHDLYSGDRRGAVLSG